MLHNRLTIKNKNDLILGTASLPGTSKDQWVVVLSASNCTFSPVLPTNYVRAVRSVKLSNE